MLKKIWKVVAIAVLLALLLVFVPSPLNTYDAFAEIVTLPIDQTGGLKYDPANYTSDTHYEDPSITVDIYWGGRIYDTNYVYAVIKIANASQLRTAFAFNYSSPGDGKRVADMAKKMNGVFAINGDYYSHSWHTNGYMVRQGKVYRNRPNKTCVVTTHRPSVLNLCQRVYRVMDGRVTELSEEESSRMAMEF